MLAKDIMTRNVTTCRPDASLRAAAQLMRDHDCGCLPVTRDDQGDQLVGLVPDRDLACRAVADGMDASDTPVSSIMSSPVETVDEGTPVEECVRRLREKQIRRLVVVGADGRCSGVIAQGDLAREMPEQRTGELVKQVSKPDQGKQPKPAPKKAAGAVGKTQRSR